MPHYTVDTRNCAHPGIVDTGEVVEFLPGDHEGREVGCVDGQEHHREHRPHVRHEPGEHKEQSL